MLASGVLVIVLLGLDCGKVLVNLQSQSSWAYRCADTSKPGPSICQGGADMALVSSVSHYLSSSLSLALTFRLLL